MEEKAYLLAHPSLYIQATSSVYNPWYAASLTEEGKYDLALGSVLYLPTREITLIFQGNRIFFMAFGIWDLISDVVFRIREFVSYRTFSNYNTIGIATSDELWLAQSVPVPLVNYRIKKLAGGTEIITVDGQRIEANTRTVEDNVITLRAEEIDQYLEVVNDELYFAMASYLLGCDNPRYFLVEFYKAVEVIKNTFESEQVFLRTFAPYGVTRGNYTKFRRLCNDDRNRPLSIARHAPQRGEEMTVVDIRRLLDDPPSRAYFEFASMFCRQIIDSYLQLLAASTNN